MTVFTRDHDLSHTDKASQLEAPLSYFELKHAGAIKESTCKLGRRPSVKTELTQVSKASLLDWCDWMQCTGRHLTNIARRRATTLKELLSLVHAPEDEHAAPVNNSAMTVSGPR